MSLPEALGFMRARAASYERAFPTQDYRLTQCVLSALGRGGCGAWVPPYNIGAILRSLADEMERAP